MEDLAMRLEAAAKAAGQTDDGSDDDGVEVDGADGDTDAQEALASSEGTSGDEEVDEATDEDEVPQTPPTQQPTTFSRLQRNMGIKERELAAEREARRADQAEIRRLSQELETARSPALDPDADIVDAVRGLLVQRIGAKDPSDPRLAEALRDAVVELTIEAYPDGQQSKALAERKEQRDRDREVRQNRRELQALKDSLDAERLKNQEQAQESKLLGSAAQFLAANAERTPFLSAAAEAGEIDPASFVLKVAKAGVTDGTYRDPQSMEELAGLYGQIIGNLEAHYRGVAESLSARMGNKSPRPLATAQQPKGKGRRVPPAQDRGSVEKARNTRGGGGRGTAAPVQAPDEDGPRDLAARLAAAERQARRRAR